MAQSPLPDSNFFPPLDRCLSGETQLLSWKDVYEALCDFQKAGSNEELQSFLTDEQALDILSHPLDPFPASSAQAKGRFQTKTAAINVPTSENGQYDLEDLKADTQWLTDNAWVDEMTALRMVMLEWQTRPASQLLSGFTEEEFLSVKDASAGTNLAASKFLPASSILAATPGREGLEGFSSKEQRRFRLLKLNLLEKVHILRISDILLRFHVFSENNPGGQPAEWLLEIGQTLFNGQQKEEKDKSGKTSFGFIDDAIIGIQRRLERLEKGSGWYENEGGSADMEEVWGLSQMVEIIHTFQLIFTHLDYQSSDRSVASDRSDVGHAVPPTRTVLAWFRFVHRFGFFLDFVPPYTSQQALTSLFQSFVSAVSLQMLSLNNALETLDSSHQFSTSPDEHSSYITNPRCLGELNSIFLLAIDRGSGPAIPSIFAWSFIAAKIRDEAVALRNEREHQHQLEGSSSPDLPRGSISTTRLSPIEEALAFIMDVEMEDDPIIFLGSNAVNSGAFLLIRSISNTISEAFQDSIDRTLERQVRRTFLNLVRQGVTVIQYTSEVVDATLTLLSGHRRHWDLFDNGQTMPEPVDQTITDFLSDETHLIPLLYDQAMWRYPYETGAFVGFYTAFAKQTETGEDGTLKTTMALEGISTFTQVMPRGFRSYRLIREDENANYVALDEDLPLFSRIRSSGNQRLIGYHQETQAEEMVIARDTQGKVNGTSPRHITTWDYPHSALQYLSNLLATTIGDDLIEYPSDSQLPLDAAADVVNLFAVLLTSSITTDKENGGSMHPESAARRLLVNASASLNNQDLVAVIFDLFEQELQRLVKEPSLEDSLDVLIKCTYFIHALMSVQPERVWPLMSRSRLLDSNGSGGALGTIVAGTEMVLGRYEFLVSCIHLFDALVEDSVRQTISRKSGKRSNTKTLSRFTSPQYQSPITSGAPDRSMRDTILNFEKVLMSIFESSISWRFFVIEDKMAINGATLNVFCKILRYVFGFDDNQDLSKKLTGILAPAAEYLVDVFLSVAANNLPINPILNILSSGTEALHSTLYANRKQALVSQTISALELSTNLIRVSMLIGRPDTHLQQQLFKACPILARLLSAHYSFKGPAARLLETLVRSAGQTSDNPASLLGHLGPSTTKAFLSTLSTLGKPFQDTEVEGDIWRLLSAVVSCKQQWLSIFLLTGNTPRESFKTASSKVQHRGKPLLKIALDQLSDMSKPDVNPDRILPMLEFVSLAQNFWPWAMKDLRDHKEFLKSATTLLSRLSAEDSKPKKEKMLHSCKWLHMASFVCEILAMYLHHARQVGDLSLVKDLIPALGYLREYGAAVPYYNHSLHTYLNRNFVDKFSCNLSQFKRTLFMSQDFGESYFYDLDFATKILGFNPAWNGTNDRGFSNEVRMANLNLSLVESQVNLLKSWKLLAIELSTVVTSEPKLSKLLSGIVESCLVANSNSSFSEELFRRLIYIRADFAFTLLQRLVSAKVDTPETRSLFLLAWETIRASPDFDSETFYAGSIADYHRILLKILFLSLHFHLAPNPHSKSQSMSQSKSRLGNSTMNRGGANPKLFVELESVVQNLICAGFRGLCSLLHDNPAAVSPNDFVLLTALLQTILRLPNAATLHVQITLLLAEHSVPRLACTLFSWSHSLNAPGMNSSNNTNNRSTTTPDPIYALLVVLFLLTLSSMPAAAELLATESVLSNLAPATVLNYLRRPTGTGPFDEPSRVYTLWSQGILPLCLNLLRAVGAPVAAEVAGFLNGFSSQLNRAQEAFAPTKRSRQGRDGAGHVTLSLACEAYSLALISRILTSLRDEGGSRSEEMPELDWDGATVRVDIDALLASKRALRERIVPVNEREVDLVRDKEGGESKLEERIVRELEDAVGVLSASLNGNGGTGG